MTTKNTATKSTTDVTAIDRGAGARAALLTIEKQMNLAFAEREREVHGMLVALVAREHVLLLGPPGTAKSGIANVFCGAIDGATFFQRLLTRFSTPEELFGPISLAGLKADRHRRVTPGYLPEATIAFVDEIYKANSAVLNAMLTILNERAFDNDGARHSVPIEMVVGAANELPEGPDLAALHDRFMLRFWTQYTKEPSAFARLLLGAEPAITARLSAADLALAQSEVARLPISHAAVDELFKLREEFKKESIVASDRRWRKAAQILRASAWLDGATEVTPEAFPVLASVMWETTDQITKLQKLVSKYTSAELSEAQEIVDAMAEVINGLPPDTKETKEARNGALMSIMKELKKGIKRIGDLRTSAQGAQTKVKITAMENDLQAKIKVLQREAQEAIGI